MMQVVWKQYSNQEVDRLAAHAPPMTDRSERTCPACARRAVRTYYYERERFGRPIGVLYAWCANCCRYTSSVGEPLSPLFAFDTPDEAADVLARARRVDDPRMIIERLDALWNSGVLPQKFTRRARK